MNEHWYRQNITLEIIVGEVIFGEVIVGEVTVGEMNCRGNELSGK